MARSLSSWWLTSDCVTPQHCAAAVMFYNDHGLNFFLDKMPTFAVGAAPEYRNADEGWGIPTLPPFKGELDPIPRQPCWRWRRFEACWSAARIHAQPGCLNASTRKSTIARTLPDRCWRLG